MPYCSRIRKNCENRCITIVDTNAFIHYMQYLSETKYSRSDFNHILGNFRNLINVISNNCSSGKLFASGLVLKEEYKKTFIFKVEFLNNLDRVYQSKFIQILEDNLKTREVNKKSLKSLKAIADKFSARRRSSSIDVRDLSLLLVALEEIKDHPNWKFLIVSGDDSFRKFISNIKSRREINLAGKRFNTFNVNGVILLTYLAHLFKCCQYNDLKDFRLDILKRVIEHKNVRVKNRKLEKYNKWIFEVFGPIYKEKDSLGVCT